MVLVLQITEDSPNFPKFSPAKLSRYTVFTILNLVFWFAAFMFLLDLDLTDWLIRGIKAKPLSFCMPVYESDINLSKA